MIYCLTENIRIYIITWKKNGRLCETAEWRDFMYTQVKSSNGITLVPIETKLMGYRTLFLTGDITEETALNFVKSIMILAREEEKEPIKIFINSSGGEINAGLLIYDCIVGSTVSVKMYCLGKAYSMAAVIFSAGTHGERYILENSEIMLHEPLLGNRVGGNSSSIKSISDTLLETKGKLNEILAKHTGKKREEIDEATQYDHYFCAKEAIEFGLADQIISFSEMLG